MHRGSSRRSCCLKDYGDFSECLSPEANNGLHHNPVSLFAKQAMSSEDKQYGKQTARQTERQTDSQTDSIDNGDPRQCSGGKLKMVMKMKSYEYYAPFASPRQVGTSGSSQRGK